MKLCYTALSPFCRKTRMAMEYKNLLFELSPGDDLTRTEAWNERAEVPILIDGNVVVCNSHDILYYLDKKHPKPALYSEVPDRFAEIRNWERFADTFVDSVFTVIGNWRFADLPPMPKNLMQSARRDANLIYDRLENQLSRQEFVCGEQSAADFALYPHIASGAVLDLPFDKSRHQNVARWQKSLRDTDAGQSDLRSAREWWQNQDSQEVDTHRVNWGTYRLEWLLANGGVDWFADQVHQDKVLWSTGAGNNALKNERTPGWAVSHFD